MPIPEKPYPQIPCADCGVLFTVYGGRAFALYLKLHREPCADCAKLRGY